MRNIDVLNITARPASVPRSAIESAGSSPDSALTDLEVFAPLRTGGAGPAADEAGAETPVTEISIQVQGAAPQNSHLDIRVNDTPLLGVMFDEAAQTITGVIPANIAAPYRVEITQSDGQTIVIETPLAASEE